MTLNFDVNKIRHVLRGEINGSVRLLVLLACAAAVWLGGYWVSGMARSASSRLTLTQSHYAEISRLAAEFRNLSPNSAAGEDIDIILAFAQISTRIELAGRVSRVSHSPDGRRSVVEINRMYAEELTEMIHELSVRGIEVISAEIFTIPAAGERLFRLNLTIGTEA